MWSHRPQLVRLREQPIHRLQKALLAVVRPPQTHRAVYIYVPSVRALLCAGGWEVTVQDGPLGLRSCVATVGATGTAAPRGPGGAVHGSGKSGRRGQTWSQRYWRRRRGGGRRRREAGLAARKRQAGVGLENPRAAGRAGVGGHGLGRSHAGGEVVCRGNVRCITGFVCTSTTGVVWVQIEQRRYRASRGPNAACCDGGCVAAGARVAGNKATRSAVVMDTGKRPVATRVVVVAQSANAYFGAGPLMQL